MLLGFKMSRDYFSRGNEIPRPPWVSIFTFKYTLLCSMFSLIFKHKTIYKKKKLAFFHSILTYFFVLDGNTQIFVWRQMILFTLKNFPNIDNSRTVNCDISIYSDTIVVILIIHDKFLLSNHRIIYKPISKLSYQCCVFISRNLSGS